VNRMGSITHGFVAPGFEDVAQAFERNFADEGEVGATFAAYRSGECVVDIWGGLADRRSGAPWREDTLQLIFSGTKGLSAICVLVLIDRGLLALDAPVATYWPEFGKLGIRVRDAMSHSARLPGIERPVRLEELADGRRMAGLLAEQEPSQDPRAANCYHALTYGWLCGELVRRVDGRSIGRFFAEEVAGPLKLELWIGLPAEQEHRVSTLELAPEWGSQPFLDPSAVAEDPLIRTVWGNPPILERDTFAWNTRAFHEAEIPAANAIGTARSVARLYDSLVSGDGGLVSESTMRLARETLAEGHDAVHDVPMRWGVGFGLQTELHEFGPPPDAFGVGGAGGSEHGAWPALGVGFSYAMNFMRDDQKVDPRAQALLGALHRCVS